MSWAPNSESLQEQYVLVTAKLSSEEDVWSFSSMCETLSFLMCETLSLWEVSHLKATETRGQSSPNSL